MPVRQPPNRTTRRHTDSPALWIAVLTGSFVLNGVSALSFQRALQRMQPAHTPFAPIAVSFVSVPASSGAAKKNTTPGKQATVPKASPQKSSSKSSKASRPSTTTASTGNDGIAYSSTKTRSRPSPKKPSKPASPTEVSKQPQQDESLTEKPISAAPSQTESAPISNPSLTPPTDEVATSGVLLPGVPNVPDPSKSTPDEIAKTPTNSFTLDQKPLPAKFLAELKILPEVSDRSTSQPADAMGEMPASPSEKLTKTLTSNNSECLLLPEALRKFNQPVVLNVPVDATGRLATTPVSVQNSSGNDSYDALAICALKTWRAIPKSAIAIAGYNDPSNLKVQLTLKVVGKAN